MGEDINIIVLCGEKGVGKTTYAHKEWDDALYMTADNPLCDITTYSATASLLELFEINDQVTKELYFGLSSILKKYKTVIIDSTELLHQDEFKLILNISKIEDVDKLILIFDEPCQTLIKNTNYQKLVEENIIKQQITDFKVSNETLINYIISQIHEVTEEQCNNIMKLTKHNFININMLVCIINTTGSANEILSENVLINYTDYLLKKVLKNMDSSFVKIIKQSSVVGEIFDSCVLESEKGFSIIGIAKYLEKIKRMHLFIKNYMNTENQYQFITPDMHKGIYEGISQEDHLEWSRIIIEFYLQKLNTDIDQLQSIKYLYHLQKLYKSINDLKEVFKINKLLFHKYVTLNDTKKLLDVTRELLQYNDCSSKGFNQYIRVYRTRLLHETGCFEDELNALRCLYKDKCYEGSPQLLRYYYANCLYNCGNVEKSYYNTKELIKYLKDTSHTNKSKTQTLYSLTYSLMATIQNHLGMDDGGDHYYRLALNHSFNNIDDKNIYYDILKKCDMFYSYEEIRICLIQCIEYYKLENNTLKLGQVYLNLATEIMFQKGSDEINTISLLNQAEQIFINFPNERLVYVQNNMAIYYILEEDNPQKALDKLEKTHLIGLSDFTNMTTYLNHCVCLILLGKIQESEFKKTHEQFQYYLKKVRSRKCATKYDMIYDIILSLVIEEHSTDMSSAKTIIKEWLADDSLASFFKPILEDMLVRRTKTCSPITREDNKNYYEKIHTKRIFLAEFRFWE